MKRIALCLFLCLTPVAASADAATMQANTEKMECQKNGGEWAGDIKGRGRSWGCILPTQDAGKTCKDASDCPDSHYCIMGDAICDGKRTKAPADFDKCEAEGECYGKSFPPKGCHAFVEQGKYKQLCLE